MKKLFIILIILLSVFITSCSFKMDIKNPFRKGENTSFNPGENYWKTVNL